MKKRCLYCREIIKINEEEIRNIKDNGRGIHCPWCGEFISVPKKINNDKCNTSHDEWKKIKRDNRYGVISFFLIIILLCVITPIYFIFRFDSFNNVHFQEQKYCTFMFIDNETNYDVTINIEISILIPKENVVMDNEIDASKLNNYKVYIDGMNASLVIFDARKITYYIIHVDPYKKTGYYDGIYLHKGGINYNYVFYVRESIGSDDLYYGSIRR